MRVLILLAFALAACAAPDAPAPEARALTLQATETPEECHATARTNDTLVLFEAANCQEGEIVLIRVLAARGVVLDGGVMGGGFPVEWYPRPGEFTAIETESGRVIASINNP